MAIMAGIDSTTNKVENIEVTQHHGHVKLPENIFGTVSVYETTGTDSVVVSTYNFPNGLNGAAVANYCSAQSTAITADVNIYVAFNNTAISDAAVNGMRYTIGPNASMSFPFPSTPKPTKMYIAVDSINVKAFHVAAEV